MGIRKKVRVKANLNIFNKNQVEQNLYNLNWFYSFTSSTPTIMLRQKALERTVIEFYNQTLSIPLKDKVAFECPDQLIFLPDTVEPVKQET